jgi:hypothetical protein
LCEQAEALKDSEDWKKTTDKFIALQKEWRTVGQVSRKHSDAVWKRFSTACDVFFERKSTHFSSHKTEEQENLQQKKDIIEQVNNFDTTIPAAQAIAKLKAFRAQFNEVGHVPFREKDKIHEEFDTAMDVQFARLRIASEQKGAGKGAGAKGTKGTKDAGTGEKSKTRLLGDRDHLLRQHERLRNDIQTYENNIGFLSVSSKSKGGNAFITEMQRKIDDLKAELFALEDKIEATNESLGV